MIQTEIILALLPAVGILNGLAFGIHLFFSKIGLRKANIFLGIFILLLSIRFLRSLHFYLTPIYFHVEFLVSSICFLLLGPILYFYVSSSLKPAFRLKISAIFHLLVLAPLFVFPINSVIELPVFKILTYSTLLILLGYSLISFRLLIKIIKSKKTNIGFIKVADKQWFRNLLTLIILNVIVYGLNLQFHLIPNIFGAISYAIILYAIFIYWNNLRLVKKQLNNIEKYQNLTHDPKKAQEILNLLLLKITEEEIYKDYTLTLPRLAQAISIPQHYLSMLINQNLNKSFPEFINEYRINEACKMLTSKDFADESIQSIAYSSGFNSISVFYAYFKKHTGLTPTEYKSNLKLNKNIPNL